MPDYDMAHPGSMLGCHVARDIDMSVYVRFCVGSRNLLRIVDMGLVVLDDEGSDRCRIIFLLRAAQVSCAIIRTQ